MICPVLLYFFIDFKFQTNVDDATHQKNCLRLGQLFANLRIDLPISHLQENLLNHGTDWISRQGHEDSKGPLAKMEMYPQFYSFQGQEPPSRCNECFWKLTFNLIAMQINCLDRTCTWNIRGWHPFELILPQICYSQNSIFHQAWWYRSSKIVIWQIKDFHGWITNWMW